MGDKSTCWVVMSNCFFGCATLEGLCDSMLLYAPLFLPVIRSSTNVGPKHTFRMAATRYSSSIQSHTSHCTLVRRRLDCNDVVVSHCHFISLHPLA